MRTAFATGICTETQKNTKKITKYEKQMNVATNVAKTLAAFVVGFLMATFAVNNIALSEPGTSQAKHICVRLTSGPNHISCHE